MAKWGNTTFYEFCGNGRGPDEQFSTDVGGRVIRQLDVVPGTVAARQQAVADFLGYAVVKTDNGNYISRGTPLPYVWGQTTPSNIPTGQYLFAANIVRGEPLSPNGTTFAPISGGPPGQANTFAIGGNFARYRYTVEFTTRLYDIKTDTAVNAVAATMTGGNPNVPVVGSYSPSPLLGVPDEGQMLAGKNFTQYPNWPPGAGQTPKFSTSSRYITRFFRPATRTLVLPFGMMQWFSDGLPMREGFPYQEAMGSCRYTWHCVPEAGVPFYAIQKCLGGINNYWFDGFAPNTLMFKSLDLKRYIGPLGDVLYTVEYLFSWLPKRSINGTYAGVAGQPLGWNYQLRVKGAPPVLDYDQVVDSPNNASPRNPYPGADFTSLFRPDN